MSASTESRYVGGSGPVNWVVDAAPAVEFSEHTLAKSWRVLRGDPDGLLVWEPLPELLATASSQVDFEADDGPLVPSLPNLFDCCTADGAEPGVDQIDAVIFADGDVAGLDWSELSLSAAGVTPADQTRRVFTGDTTPTGLKSLRTWATEQLSVKGASCADLTLVVSELVTNVERYAPGWVMVDLVFYRDLVMVAVTDRSADKLPRLEAGSLDDTSGRGLWIVSALSVAWGVVRRGSSKTVWSLLPCGYHGSPLLDI